MENTKEEKLAALAFMLAEVTSVIVEHSLVSPTATKVTLFDDVEATLGELIARTQVLAREVLGHNETVH